MDLALPYPPTPEHAADHAACAVDAALRSDGTVLDYAPDTLGWVDEALDGYRADGLPLDDVGTAVFLLGCYVGEVLIRGLGGPWVRGRDSLASTGPDDDALVVELDDGFVERPVSLCFRRVLGEESVPVALVYRVAAGLEG